MKQKVVIPEERGGGYKSAMPSIPGCASQAEAFDELLVDLDGVIEGGWSVDCSESLAGEAFELIEVTARRPAMGDTLDCCSHPGGGI